jgi:hypothetical protein
MTVEQAGKRDASGEAPRLTTAAKTIAALLAVFGCIVGLLGLLLAGGSSADSAMGRAFMQLGYLAAGIGLLHVVIAVLALTARWLGRILALVLGAAGCVCCLLTANGGGALTPIGLLFYGAVLAVFAFRWRVPPLAHAEPVG